MHNDSFPLFVRGDKGELLLMNNDQTFKTFRKSLRKNQTNVERLLWSKLRNKQLKGAKFYRQYSIGPYIVDFYCFKHKLAVELDGGQHNNEFQIENDNNRTHFLQKHRIKVLRFWNNDVLSNLDGIMEVISKHVK